MNHAQEIIAATHEENEKIAAALNYLFNMFNIDYFEDEDGDGTDDNPDESDTFIDVDDNNDGLVIDEWTGEE